LIPANFQLLLLVILTGKTVCALGSEMHIPGPQTSQAGKLPGGSVGTGGQLVVGAGVVGVPDEVLEGSLVGTGEIVGILVDGSGLGKGEMVGAVGSILGEELGNELVSLLLDFGVGSKLTVAGAIVGGTVSLTMLGAWDGSLLDVALGDGWIVGSRAIGGGLSIGGGLAAGCNDGIVVLDSPEGEIVVLGPIDG
jgi:hypothetical protein